MKVASTIVASTIAICATLISGCAPLLSGAMNASLDENAVVEKTAKYFGASRNELVISGIEKKALTTTYQTKYDGVLYNCSIYYGDVTCTQPGEKADVQAPPAQGANDAPTPLSERKMTIAQAQTRMNQLGYRVGTPDGVLGKNTIRQLKLYQQAKGLPVTGKLDDATAAALR